MADRGILKNQDDLATIFPGCTSSDLKTGRSQSPDVPWFPKNKKEGISEHRFKADAGNICNSNFEEKITHETKMQLLFSRNNQQHLIK